MNTDREIALMEQCKRNRLKSQKQLDRSCAAKLYVPKRRKPRDIRRYGE